MIYDLIDPPDLVWKEKKFGMSFVGKESTNAHIFIIWVRWFPSRVNTVILQWSDFIWWRSVVIHFIWIFCFYYDGFMVVRSCLLIWIYSAIFGQVACTSVIITVWRDICICWTLKIDFLCLLSLILQTANIQVTKYIMMQ